jgi:hypothetical protein
MDYNTLESKYSDPDISIGSFYMWVHERQYPDDDDYWDGNWLQLTAFCESNGASVVVEGAILTAICFSDFLNELKSMDTTLTGEATLGDMEPELQLKLAMGSLGAMGLDVSITPDSLNQEHTFRFGLDQSYLKKLLAEIAMIVDRFPVKGKRE